MMPLTSIDNDREMQFHSQRRVAFSASLRSTPASKSTLNVYLFSPFCNVITVVATRVSYREFLVERHAQEKEKRR